MYNQRFGNRSQGGRDSFRGNSSGRDFERTQLYDATCDECGKDCKVPFKPSGDRPIYCSDCFEKRGNGRDDRGGQRNSFAGREDRDNQRSSFNRPQFSSNRDREVPSPRVDPSFSQLNKNIEMLNSKLDRLISLMGSTSSLPKKEAYLDTPKKKESKIGKVIGLAEMVSAFKTTPKPSVTKKKKKIISTKNKGKKAAK